MSQVHPVRFSARLFGILLIVQLALLGIVLRPVHAHQETQIQPDAGTWMTWVLDSGDALRVDAPPDEAATQAEIAELIALASERDDAALGQIAYWNNVPPSVRWNQIAVNELLDRGIGFPANRALALLQAAIYDATVAAWDSKYAFNRPRPSDVDPGLETVIPNPSSPSYPSEYAVTAGAASAVLAYLFPDDAQQYQELADESVRSRLLAGVEYPSDAEAGLALGRAVAELAIARAMTDGTDAQWTGSVPTEPGHWTGENPIMPMAGTFKPWALTAGDQFRPPAPPAHDSEQMAVEMQELRDFARTPGSTALANFWNFGSGGTRNWWHWNSLATRFILENDLQDNAPMAALVYALTNIAGYDSFVACFDAKYTYWSMRPSQVDPEFAPQFANPNFPSYPSAHSCISMAYAEVLADLFPLNAAEVIALAEQAGDSRLWAGIHFRSDIDAGEDIGRNVAEVVLGRAGLAGDS